MAIDLANRAPSIWSPAELILNVAALALGAHAVSAAVRGRFRGAIATASAAFLVTLAMAWSMQYPVFTGFWHFPLAIVLLVPLLWHRPPAAAGLLRYAPAVPLLMIVADQVSAQAFPGISGILQRGFVLALWAGSLLWLAVDERLPMAFGLLLLNGPLVQLAFIVAGGAASLAAAAVALVITAAVPGVLLVTSSLAARRRARI
jgi:hypothetical protein